VAEHRLNFPNGRAVVGGALREAMPEQVRVDARDAAALLGAAADISIPELLNPPPRSVTQSWSVLARSGRRARYIRMYFLARSPSLPRRTTLPFSWTVNSPVTRS
jgi:hypothetical protein